MEVNVFNIKGKETGRKIKLDKAVFGIVGGNGGGNSRLWARRSPTFARDDNQRQAGQGKSLSCLTYVHCGPHACL